ncbi:leucine-rich repeat domain-containing protein [Paenibacillus ginsengarvi]|uniref:Leucine-rich repeat domain-containing protein n=1 Tax=Paenibacillus ginsengarvi TaxID=400777 RepID=A0A3B0BFT8_9BACL|nr:leucine-rich repeat domain-containing protein [Paenibacillus ginsengarvi]RKN71188.1 leucine-rich repeat domain-containing protein [Paenibacillus ginsengarvi]
MIAIYNDPKGEAYRRLVDYAVRHSATFALAEREYRELSETCAYVFEALRPYLIRSRSCESLLGTSAIAYTREGTIYVYRCCPEAADILKTASPSLFAWQHPQLPEDLTFMDEEGRDWLMNVAHEQSASLNIEEEEAKRLSEEIDGLFLTGEFNRSLDAMIRDAIRHNAEKLYIEGYGIDRIPEEVGLIRSLTTLSIFEDEVTRLPGSLFGLENLEHLRVNTADLDEIPAAIGKLKNLKMLEISCGCYRRREPGQPIIDNADVGVKRLPAEIGLLSKLEILVVNYTAIDALPPEFTQLTALKYADLARNRFDSVPPELDNLPNLMHVYMGQNWVDVRGQWRHWEQALGLAGGHYERGGWLIRQQLGERNETEYVLELEWNPAGRSGAGAGEAATGANEDKDEENNLPGKVLVSVNVYSGQLRSYIIVRSGEWFDAAAERLRLASDELEAAALNWIHAHTDYRAWNNRLQFVRTSESGERISAQFRETAVDGIRLYPPNLVSVDMLMDGTVIGYSSIGASALHSVIDEGTRYPAPGEDAIRRAAYESFCRFSVPGRSDGGEEDRATVRWMYGIEETFVDFCKGETIPYELSTRHFGEPPLNRPLVWTELERQESDVPLAADPAKPGERLRRFIEGTESRSLCVDWQAKHPDSLPVDETEAEQAFAAVRAWMMRNKPDDSGRWLLNRLTRHNGMFVASVRRAEEEGKPGMFGKINLLLEPGTYGLIDAIELPAPPKVPVPELLAPEEAFARIADKLLCTPYYVWDRAADCYRYMHLLDCDTFVDGLSAETVRRL